MEKMKGAWWTICLILALAACSAEKKALKEFRMGNYESAISGFRKVLQSQPNNGRVNFYVAEAYRQSNRIRLSEDFYAMAKGPGVNDDTVRYFYSRALQANGKYDKAAEVLAQLEQSEDENMRNLGKRAAAGISELQRIGERKSYYRIKNLEALNSPFSEYSPAYLNGELYFTSSRTNDRIYAATGTPYTDLYKVSTQGANVDVNTVKALPPTINIPDVNVGTIAFTPDGRTMVFARGNTGKRRGTADVDLFISRFRNGQWGEAQPLNINLPESWESAPAFSPDGRMLYFSSNRKGGFGGLDIYSAQMDSRGRFSRVRNLGPEINTSGNESFPYVAENGKMYFSSDGHPGYGMLDIFVVNRVNGKTVVENLGQPVNSVADDFGIFLFKPDRGFFTSNREAGKGDDDIYTFINDDPNLRVINYFLQGVTYSLKNDSTREILPETKVTLLDGDGNVMQDFVTGNDGKFIFKIFENENYTLMGESDGYLIERGRYTTRGKSVAPETLKELVTNITLDTLLILDRLEKGKTFVLNNIYFGFDSAAIRPEAARELDRLVQILVDNPEIKIEMGSHTDSVDNEAYNQRLSQRRAEATVSYMIRRGIAPERLKAKGYGESKPIARNTNPDGSDNPVGRQKNRRTEFKILEIGPFLKKKDEDEDDKYFRDHQPPGSD